MTGCIAVVAWLGGLGGGNVSSGYNSGGGSARESLGRRIRCEEGTKTDNDEGMVSGVVVVGWWEVSSVEGRG